MIDSKITELKLPYPGEAGRVVRVYVPAHKEGETFPAVYMTDGQNCFDMAEELYGCWYTHKAVDEEIKSSGQGAVIVGIHNDDPVNHDPMKRTCELAPATIGEIIISEEVFPEGFEGSLNPSGEVFEDFIINTVMPYIEENFPVKTGRNNTAFCGSSMGGLMSFFTALSHPEKYCAAGVFSPAMILFTPDDIEKWVHKKLVDKMPYLYIYTGAGDKLEKNIYHATESMYDILTECYPPELLNEVVLLENKHHESAWEPIFKDFLHTFLTRRNEF